MRRAFDRLIRRPAPSAPAPPPGLAPFFLLSHLEEDGPVRADGAGIGVWEVLGAEWDGPRLDAFAGALNACDFPVQLLVRQHPPNLGGLRAALAAAEPAGLPAPTAAAAASLRRLLAELEGRDGILDRRFYAACARGRADELGALLARSGLSVHRLRGRPLRLLVLAAALGGVPTDAEGDSSSSPRTSRTCWPRTPRGPSRAVPGAPCSRTPPSSCCSSRTPPRSGRWGRRSTCPRICAAGCWPAPAGTACCSRGGSASPSASRPPRRRPR